MSILVVSEDTQAACALVSALERAGADARWATPQTNEGELGPPPLVLVADAGDPSHQAVVNTVRERAPWVQAYVMTDTDHDTDVDARRFPKPFDAAETAMMLVRARELAELERLRQTQQARADELAVLVEASFEAIVGLASDGTIRTWNRGAQKVYGYTADEAVGKNVGFLDLSSRPVCPSPTQAVVETERQHKNGEAICVLLSRSPVPAHGSERIAFAEVSLDITARKKLERELEHSERLAAVGRLVATMAHEINNPLAVISAAGSYIGELAERLKDRELAERVEDVSLATHRITDYVQQMCGFARRERPKLCETPVWETVRMALRLVKPRAHEKGVEVSVADVDDAPTPHDPPRLSQAIVNVLSNAIDAAAEGGHHVWLTVEREAFCLRIIVDDDGRGFEHRAADRLFEPFHTTKPHGEGTGLGLTITRQVMADHRGSAQLEARAGGGARAVLCLPLLDPSEHRVLVVEDDPAVRRALTGELRRAGFKVGSARSQKTALTELGKQAYQVLVTDLRLPDASGPALIRALREKAPAARCLAITGDPGPPPADVEVHLRKPWERSFLLSSVRMLCLSSVNPGQDSR